MHPAIFPLDKKLYSPLIAGCLLRLLLWIGSGDITTVGDENDYLRLGQVLSETGKYRGQWPPGYPAIISVVLRLFGEAGPTYLRLFQIFSSFIAGLFVIQMAHLLYGNRGALFAGYAWAFYLPLAFHAHRFWPETLFLNLFVPCLYLLLSYTEQKRWHRCSGAFILAVSGVLYALSLYFKESHTYLLIPLSLWLGFTLQQKRWTWIFPLSVMLVMLPLVLRNYRIFKGFVPSGSTLVTNIRTGLNAEYTNHDYNRIPKIIQKAHQNSNRTGDFVYRNFIYYGEGWDYSSSRRYLEALREDASSAANYALQNKKKFLGTRIKKIADYVTPLSFLVRDLLPNVYSGTISSSLIRRILISVSSISVICLFLIGWTGLVRLRHSPLQFTFFLIIFAYFGLTAMLNSCSRIRMPIEPLLLVLTGNVATLVANQLKGSDRAFIFFGFLAIALLWALNFEEIVLVLNKAW